MPTFGSLYVVPGGFLGFPGPRDWSPSITKAKEELKALETLVPEAMRVSLKEVKESEFHEIARMVDLGFAFIIKIARTAFQGETPVHFFEYHAVYIDPEGKIRMDLTVRQHLLGGL